MSLCSLTLNIWINRISTIICQIFMFTMFYPRRFSMIVDPTSRGYRFSDQKPGRTSRPWGLGVTFFFFQKVTFEWNMTWNFSNVTWCHLMSLDVTARFSKWMIFMIFFWCEQRREWGLLGWLWRYLWDHFPIPHQALSLDSICFSGHLESTFFASQVYRGWIEPSIGHTWEPKLNCKLL